MANHHCICTYFDTILPKCRRWRFMNKLLFYDCFRTYKCVPLYYIIRYDRMSIDNAIYTITSQRYQTARTYEI